MDYNGIKVLVMGLGLHGGGLESARFFLKRGASVTVTDLRDEKTLLPSIEKLDASVPGAKPVRYILGRHEIEDFKNADIVIKNPGVKPDSPFLQAAKRIETDISIFLEESPARLFAVTGTKGKSCTAAALHWILKNEKWKMENGKESVIRRAYLGGNITVSPLTFLDELTENDDVVLELSSFQLGDLKGRKKADGSPLLKPAAAVLTAIMSDHLDRYASMEEYINDKKTIYRGQDSSCVTVALDDEWGRSFLSETKGQPVICSLSSKEAALLLPEKLLVPGEHQKMNLLAAALAAVSADCGAKVEADTIRVDTIRVDTIREALSTFRGIEHRLEFFHEADGLRFYNDSAATIPEAAAACIAALSSQAPPSSGSPQVSHAPLVLVTGGTDKNLDFSPLAKAIAAASKSGEKTAVEKIAVILLAGSGSEKLAALLGEAGVPYSGPYDNLEKAVACCFEKAACLKTGSISSVNAVLSPGCASFGMFLNEFDRGRKWKEACIRLS